MNRIKFKNYMNDCFVHIIATEISTTDKPKQNLDCVECNMSKDGFYLKINIDKYNGEVVLSFKEYCEKMKELLNGLGINSYKVETISLGIDSTNETYYKQYSKLHNAILSSIAYTFQDSFDNLGICNNRLTSLMVNDENFQINVTKENNNGVKSRFELKSKNLALVDGDIDSIGKKIVSDWELRFKKALSDFYKTANHINSILLKQLEKEIQDCEIKTTQEFIRKNKNNFFTIKQLIDFFDDKSENYEKATKKAKIFKRNNIIEFFSKKEREQIFDLIVYKIKKYFS